MSEEEEEADIHKMKEAVNKNDDFSEDMDKSFQTNGSSSIDRIIDKVANTKNIFIDLSKKNLDEVPDKLLELEHIEYMYLEGNNIKELPEDFFYRFPYLKWLDLRNNQLTTLQSSYMSRHQYLQTLLIGGNQIRYLPIELCYLSTLTGLNIAKNPLEFPPMDVLEKGVSEIIRYMRNLMLSQNGSDLSKDPTQLGNLSLDDKPHHDDYDCEDDNDGDEYAEGAIYGNSHGGYTGLIVPSSAPESSGLDLRQQQSYPRPGRLAPGGRRHQELMPLQGQMGLVDGSGGAAEEEGMKISQSAMLHKPAAYYQIRQQYLEKARKGGDKKLVSKTASEKHDQLVHIFPEPPSLDLIERNMLEDRRKKRMQEVNEKQDAILQRKRNEETVKNFREESKRKQQNKYFEQMRKGPIRIQLEAEARIQDGPLDVRKEDLQVLSAEELSRIKIENIPRDEKPKPLSTDELAMMEAQRYQHEKELEARIRRHAEEMQERRKGPRGTAKEDMAAAQKDMQILNIIRQSLMAASGKLVYWN